MSPSDFRRLSRVRAARMDRLRKRISIASGNGRTVLIRCGGISIKEQQVATGNSREINRGNSLAINNKAINRDNNKGNRANREKKEKKVNKVRDRKVSRDRRSEEHTSELQSH